MLAASLGATTAIGAATLAYAVRAPRSSLLAPSIYRGTSGRRSIAITFDDGPSESTPALLEILQRHRAAATFFQVGANVRRLPSIAREVASAGHEIGNHSNTHPLLSMRSPAFIRQELQLAQETIEQHTSTRPRLFRAPFGVRWFGLRGAQKALGLTGVMWTVIGRDWKSDPDMVARRLLANTTAGGIVCLHDGRETAVEPDIFVTLEAVRRVLPLWSEQGFAFETVSQLLCQTN